MEIKEKTIATIVAEDFRTASVFKKHQIDFCCGGNISIEELCAKKNKNAAEIYADLEEISHENKQEADFNSWELGVLATYIEHTHHHYIEEKSIYILQFLDKLIRVKGNRYPELPKINDLFRESVQELAAHMKKEELILFPYIKKMEEAKKNGVVLSKAPFGTIGNPIEMMIHDHEIEGARFAEIANLSNNYQPPSDACNTHQVTLKMLRDFEENLHTHLHLENNILFPKALELEKEFEV